MLFSVVQKRQRWALRWYVHERLYDTFTIRGQEKEKEKEKDKDKEKDKEKEKQQQVLILSKDKFRPGKKFIIYKSMKDFHSSFGK
ncbi:hypothetical protein [Neobacillus niacini]|uniref:hypothetical protein n=1 Tax=Neobacillus niacini TaxID=86668 RepID=UPI0039837B9C